MERDDQDLAAGSGAEPQDDVPADGPAPSPGEGRNRGATSQDQPADDD